MEFKIFLEKQKSGEPESLEVLLTEVASSLKNYKISKKVIDISTPEGKKESTKIKLEEVPAIIFENVRISGQLNEYFILAIIAQLLTKDGDDQKESKLENIDEKKMRIASAFLEYHTQIRPSSENFLFLIRGSTNDFNFKQLQKYADNGTKVFILTNFNEGTQAGKLAKLGTNQNILFGHIMRTNINMALVLTVRKGRPFFGTYIRTKKTEEGWQGKWSPLLHDCVSEMKDFFIPLFMTASPVHLDGEIPPNETNRLIAKVKDNIEDIKDLFY